MSHYRHDKPSLIVELPLVATPINERILLIRFEARRRLYNAVLGEALSVLRLMRDSKHLLQRLGVRLTEEASLIGSLPKSEQTA